MKIVYVSLLDASSFGGAGEHVFGVSNGLAKLGHEVHLIVGHSEPLSDTSFAHDKLNLHLVSYQGLSVFQTADVLSGKALKLIEAVKPEIVYLRAFPLDIYFISRKLYKMGVPFVYELNAITDAEYRSTGQALKGKVYTWFEGRTLALAAGWAPVTDEILKYALRVSSSNKPKPYFFARNGIDFDDAIADVSRADLRKDIGVSESKTVLIMAGFSRPWHGSDRAMKMVSLLKSEVELWLVGSPNEHVTKETLLLAKELGVYGSVRVFPWMNKQEMANMIGAADIGISALAIDRQGMAEAEALKTRLCLAMGLPVLVNHIDPGLDGSLPFVLNIISNDPNDLAIRVDKLIESKADFKDGARAYAREHFSWDVVAEETAEFMSQLIEKRDEV